jgi:Spy/CpxP family protein refolding chaperone
MLKFGAVVLAAGLISGGPLFAQTSHQHGAAGHGAQTDGAHECAMHAGGHAAGHGTDLVHRYAPKRLLEHTAMMRFTPQQVERLEALQAQHKAECHERMGLVKAAEEAASAALLLDTPDVQLFEAKSREAANLKIDCKVDMVRVGQLALATLTPEQRAHLSHMSHGGH